MSLNVIVADATITVVRTLTEMLEEAFPGHKMFLTLGTLIVIKDAQIDPALNTSLSSGYQCG